MSAGFFSSPMPMKSSVLKFRGRFGIVNRIALPITGSYWQWTAKVNGKTVNRRFNETQAALYQEWIANDRQLRDVITQMRHVAAKATELMIHEANEKAKV